MIGRGTAAILDSVLVVHVIKANLKNKMRSSSGTHERFQKILVGGCKFELGEMVYKHEDVGRLDPEKSVNKPFKNVSCQGRRPTSKKF